MKDKLVKLYLNIFNLVYPTEIEFPLPVLNIITKLVIFFLLLLSSSVFVGDPRTIGASKNLEFTHRKW